MTEQATSGEHLIQAPAAETAEAIRAHTDYDPRKATIGWVRRSIRAAVEGVGRGVGGVEKELRAEFQGEIARLRGEVAELRDELRRARNQVAELEEDRRRSWFGGGNRERRRP